MTRVVGLPNLVGAGLQMTFLWLAGVLGAGPSQRPPLPASPFLKDMFLAPIFSVLAAVGLA